MRTHLDSASTRRTVPAPGRASSAGGTPRAWWMAAQDSSPVTVDCPAPASRQVTTQPTRSVHPSRWLPPTSIPIFPYQKAEKSPQNQHVLSILHVGSHQLQYRFFRTKKPKSHHKTNTFCPLRVIGRYVFLCSAGCCCVVPRVFWAAGPGVLLASSAPMGPSRLVLFGALP